MELVVVVLCCFGVFLIPAFVHFGFSLAHTPAPKTWWARGIRPPVQLTYETIGLVGIAWFLFVWKGVNLRSFFRLSWWELACVIGFGLGAAAAGRFHLLDGLWQMLGFGAVPVWILVGLVVINPIFEEVVELGYIFHAMESRGRWPTLLTSAAVRAAIHLGFGLPFATTVFVGGLLIGGLYWRRRCLLAVILVHTIADVVAAWPHLHW